MLSGGTVSKHRDDIQTMILVGIDRLQEEYEHGKIDQLKEEHERKLVRIFFGLGFTCVSLLGAIVGIESSLLLGLALNCVVHVIL